MRELLCVVCGFVSMFVFGVVVACCLLLVVCYWLCCLCVV